MIKKKQSQVIGSHLLPDLLLLLLGRVPPSFSTGPVHLYFGPLVYCILYIYTLVLNNGSWHLKLGFAALGDKDDLVLLSLPSEGLENLGGLTLTRQLKVFHNVKGTIFCCRYSLIFQWQTKRQRDCNRIIWFLLLLFYLHLSHLEATPIAHEASKQIFAPLSHATLTSLPLSLLL